MKRAVTSTLPKNLIVRTPVQVYLCARRVQRSALHSLCTRRRWDGDMLFTTRLRDCVSNQKSVLLHSYTQSEGGDKGN
jgi:hypothetical protein